MPVGRPVVAKVDDQGVFTKLLALKFSNELANHLVHIADIIPVKILTVWSAVRGWQDIGVDV